MVNLQIQSSEKMTVYSICALDMKFHCKLELVGFSFGDGSFC
jgi:hypothetical protein